MAIKVAINGFGRIGRLTFRNLVQRSDAQARIVSPAGMGPAGVAFFVTGTQNNNLRLPLRTACCSP